MIENIPQRVYRDIRLFAKKHDVEKVILFGSRARGTHSERSDIDIAVLGAILIIFTGILRKIHIHYSCLMLLIWIKKLWGIMWDNWEGGKDNLWKN